MGNFKVFGPMTGQKVADPGVVQQLENLEHFKRDKSAPMSKYFDNIHLFSLNVIGSTGSELCV